MSFRRPALAVAATLLLCGLLVLQYRHSAPTPPDLLAQLGLDRFAYPTAYPTPTAHPTQRRNANATLLMLARDAELDGVLASVRSLEARFNTRAGYDWVFLNDGEFSAEFMSAVLDATGGKASFGLIPRADWVQPDWIDEELAAAGRVTMAEAGIVYANSTSYRNMCRFNSGFFFRHPLLQQYKWYWRVEPNVQFHCNVDFDPFRFMEERKKTYGFVLSLHEFPETIPTLWNATREFARDRSDLIAAGNNMELLSSDAGETYNGCHFWSNFEIADMDFWRGRAYTAYFEHLDARGGFYYERWGDAPVHSIAAALLLPASAIHFFDRIGYTHAPLTHCPRDRAYRREAQCDCSMRDNMDYRSDSCTARWLRIMQERAAPG